MSLITFICIALFRAAAIHRTFADNLSAGKLKFDMLDYGVKDGWLNFGTNIKPFLSGKYKRGDALSDDDVCAIRTAMLNGQLQKSNIIITQPQFCE